MSHQRAYKTRRRGRDHPRPIAPKTPFQHKGGERRGIGAYGHRGYRGVRVKRRRRNGHHTGIIRASYGVWASEDESHATHARRDRDESRAEQRRAEESRGEQRSAEESRGAQRRAEEQDGDGENACTRRDCGAHVWRHCTPRASPPSPLVLHPSRPVAPMPLAPLAPRAPVALPVFMPPAMPLACTRLELVADECEALALLGEYGHLGFLEPLLEEGLLALLLLHKDPPR